MKKNINLIYLLIPLCYIFLELTFNLTLIDFLNSKNTEIKTFDYLEIFGRLLSSFGLSLFLIKFFNNYFSIKIKSIIFILSLLLIYLLQSLLINSIISSLSKEEKFLAYSAGVFKNINSSKKEINHYNKIINSSIYLLTFNKEEKNKINEFTQNYFKLETVNIFPKNFKNDLEKLYDKINIQQNIKKKYWNIYQIESRRYEKYTGFGKEKYYNYFIEKIGMPPSLSKNDFENELNKKIVDKDKIDNIYIIPEIKNNNFSINSLQIKDIPKNINKEDFLNFIDTHIENSINNFRYNINNAEKFPYYEKVVSSVVISPLIIILSLITFLLNIGMLIYKYNKKLLIIYIIFLIIPYMFYNNNPYKLNPYLNKIYGLQNVVLYIFAPYQKLIHNIFINDKNPKENNLIKINKIELPKIETNLSKIEQDFKEIENNNLFGSFEKIERDIKIEEDKANNNNYYGEINKENTYKK